MYGVYKAERLEKRIKTAHALHNRQSMYEKLFAGLTKLTKIILKCMEIVVYNIMPLIQCSI